MQKPVDSTCDRLAPSIVEGLKALEILERELGIVAQSLRSDSVILGHERAEEHLKRADRGREKSAAQ